MSIMLSGSQQYRLAVSHPLSLPHGRARQMARSPLHPYIEVDESSMYVMQQGIALSTTPIHLAVDEASRRIDAVDR